MLLLVALPTCFLALSWVLPALTSPVTPNDPFHALALKAPKQPTPLICRLEPLPALDAVEGELLISFEEWKAKRLAMEAQAKAKAKEKDYANRSAHAHTVVGTGAGAGSGSDAPSALSDDLTHSTSISTMQDPTDNQQEKLSPHFQVPLTDRFNYASLDCSARVHNAHRSAKSPSAILSSKRDRYMLSPCASSKSESQFFVVELCEDIRIDTVQLANFEFFSGVFKDFTVNVAKTYTTDAAGWTVVGSYRAKNVRGVQVCSPNTARDVWISH
jgi:hypothetical protein